MTAAKQLKVMRRVTHGILAISERSHPVDFQVFIGAMLANVTGALPDDYWAKMMDCQPCDTPGCNCHIVAAQTMKALDALREDHRKTLAKRSVNN